MTSLLALSPCWFLSGPTASGKSAVGLALAEQVGAEIASMDSMAVFRGLEIGTAKPSSQDRERIPHHLLDLVEPSQDYSLSDYVRAAHEAHGRIVAAGRTTLFVGGTPLYLKALLRGMFEGPAADWELRHRLMAEEANAEPGWLHRRLRDVDPVSAARLHAHDTRRLVRALEVYEKTGRPISDFQRQFDIARPPGECRAFWLDWPRDELYQRINARVERMFADGLVDEVRGLLACGVTLSRTARQALGYREVLAYLAGEQNLEQTVTMVQAATRKFARRQLTWFRSLPECQRVEVFGGLDAQDVARRISRLGNPA